MKYWNGIGIRLIIGIIHTYPEICENSIFCYEYGLRPHVSSVFSGCVRKSLKTLSRVEILLPEGRGGWWRKLICTGMSSVDVSRGKHTTPPKRSVMLLYRDKNGDFSVHWVTPRTLGQSSDCLTFSKRFLNVF